MKKNNLLLKYVNNFFSFKKIINTTAEILKVKPNKENLASFRVIADHLRAS